MEFFVFIIYGIVVSEWVLGADMKKISISTCRGHGYYRTIAIINMFVGFIGLFVFNYFLRDKGIIPVWSFWIGFMGFALLVVSGVFNAYKMLKN